MFLKSVQRSTRGIHTVPKLANQDAWLKNGIKGLYSAQGFKESWVDYQQYLVDNLTMRTVGTLNETRTPFEIIKATYKNASDTTTFHYASQCFNNHLFFEQVADSGASDSAPSPNLEYIINKSFGSLEDLKADFEAELTTLNGQGWVFLVENNQKELEIVSCINEGTPYFHSRNQNLDLSSQITIDDVTQLDILSQFVKNGNREPFNNVPLICFNSWHYAYLHDYGVNGKVEFLQKFWDCLNWNVINQRLFNQASL
ncbi:37S ribosomal protein S26, mitochondrial [Komagataella phaffii CBS 7435]|uniref:Mitochondrial ribosomal protein of the small subunit n=2 Tax=Komagataella phaffii TaxID=460519 RepID=C4R8X9_KOMPG|nr:Mitochondrial ribosomal protein of the small subunit [Komagataella phaffii GS115]AOA65113.1 GQ67_05176T0 [Komagataella phaffii]CAH2450538.1 37S ribosomal protein S26, mitochondrial [Komagataella phaffii CBS 7435]AOA69554.1 GQ68_05158T0 [Komagataella phaffii GS115]CAY72054.1 Mitochondrial ribosomal protein of the small subunit [Komagataella phaffii GS115]CCA40342.1 37S ribosomal protein S26, mitochondrial [Komagataella phaffii CBS 7435]